MTPLSVAMLVIAGVLLAASPVVFVLFVLAGRKRQREKLDRWASIYSLQRAKGESNRKLLRRIRERSDTVFGLEGPHRRRKPALFRGRR